MASIEFSPAFIGSARAAANHTDVDMLRRVWGSPDAATVNYAQQSLTDTPANNAFRPILCGGRPGTETTYRSSQVYIMSGTRPDVNTITDYAVLQSDVLLIYSTLMGGAGTPAAYASNMFTLSSPAASTVAPPGNVLSFTSSHVAAIKTGVATWFMIASRNPGVTDSTLVNVVTGSVGIPGSGADLIIPSTSVVEANLYKLVNFSVTLPSTITY